MRVDLSAFCNCCAAILSSRAASRCALCALRVLPQRSARWSLSPQRTAASRRRRPSLSTQRAQEAPGAAFCRPTYHEASCELLRRSKVSLSASRSQNESRSVLCQAQHVVGRAVGSSTMQHRTGLTRPLQNLSVNSCGMLGLVFFNHNRYQHKKTTPGLSIKCGDDLVAPPCRSVGAQRCIVKHFTHEIQAYLTHQLRTMPPCYVAQF